MESTRLSSKGQIVIPHRIRRQLGWNVGLEFTVEPIGGGIALRPITRPRPTTLDQVYGCLPYTGGRKSLKDMEAAIAQGARDRR